MNLLKQIFLFIFLSICSLSLEAQLSFPNGRSLNLHTGLDYVYLETQIPFRTGQFKISDYSYTKIYDSVPTEWTVTACFNGYCRNELEKNGEFVSLGIDTSGFIAFHVASAGINGHTTVKYLVYNHKSPGDADTLSFLITYTKGLTGIIEAKNKAVPFGIYPNPAANLLKLVFPENVTLKNQLQVFFYDGKDVSSEVQLSADGMMDVSGLKNGLYFCKVQAKNKIYQQRFSVVH